MASDQVRSCSAPPVSARPWSNAVRYALFPCTVLLGFLVANVWVSRLGAALPNYASWTGVEPLERKLGLLREFARQGQVDALILSSSVGDFGISAEVLSRDLSAAY